MKTNRTGIYAALGAVAMGAWLLSFSHGFAQQQASAGVRDVDVVTYESEAASAPPSRLNVRALLGGSKLSSDSPNFRGGDVTAIMGGADIDLSRAGMIRSDATIHVMSFWGGINLKVPPGWSVTNNTTAILGGVNDNTAHPAVQGKRLTITGYVIMGGMDIKN